MTTIFAPITSIFASSVIVIRISGDDSKDILKKLTKRNNFEHRKAIFCKIFDPEDNSILDETIITFFQGPNSFSGDDLAEISIHGSSYIFQRLCDILVNHHNCRYAEPGEFSKIAFLNGKIDLTQAESIIDLIAAETKLQHQQSIKQLSGANGKIYNSLIAEIIEISSLIEASIDFPDDDLPNNIIDDIEQRVKALKNKIAQYLDDEKSGQKIKDGIKIAIFGAPNVGKSSLINYLAKSEIAIVSDIAGTTRDIVSANLNIGGMQVNLFDTAGIRKTNNKIEKLGIDLAKKKLIESDLKIYLIDVSKPIIDEKLIDNKTILVANKNDLINNKDNNDFCDVDIQISIKNNYNLKNLLLILENKIRELIPNHNQSLITNQRYRDCLTNALNYLEDFSLQKNIELAAEDLRLAGIEIGKITGKFGVEEILDVIFSKFCIGK